MTHFSTKGSTHTVNGAAWGKGQGRSGTAAECPVEAARVVAGDVVDASFDRLDPGIPATGTTASEGVA